MNVPLCSLRLGVSKQKGRFLQLSGCPQHLGDFSGGGRVYVIDYGITGSGPLAVRGSMLKMEVFLLHVKQLEELMGG